ncbi:MAG TPA: SH3 domain-containing protein [Amycolatopsis sp.]|nr:SH3 domain-containing protein [Amycolatopsis sp.]
MILGVPKKVLIVAVVLIGIGIIYVLGVDKRNSDAAGGSTGCKVTVTADVLNVRSAPDAGAEIVGKYNQNATTGAEIEIQNGFRKLADNKWAKTEFLQPVAGTNCG